ncbi:MAG: membrane protein insertion efficiency factor YidD [Thermoanaerobaculia bacterium]
MVTRPVAALLVHYKRWVSPLLPRSCRFTPTCSEYARLAILEYGLIRGGARALWRILRCNPFHPGGVDLP